MDSTVHMLSTTDNPYDPFKEFSQWNAWDEAQGYYTLAFLGRMVKTSDELSDEDQSQAIEDAIEEIVRENVSGMYVKVPASS
jgi:hypothetical protein